MTMGGETGFSAAQNDLKAASFFDGGREGVMAFAAVGLLSIMLVSQFGPEGVNSVVVTLGILASATASMILVARSFARRQVKVREAEADAYRSMLEDDRLRGIAKMKAEAAQDRKS